MIEFESLRLQNHIVFEDLTWKLNKYPVSVIRGINRDAKVITSNKVGKSLLPSTLATILTDSPPASIKKKSSRELIKNKAILTLNVRNNDNSYAIKQFAKGKSVKNSITENGVEQEVRTTSSARQLINKIVPLSSDHIFSQVYVSSYRPSILLYGSAASRLQYFEQIFDIRIYEQLRQTALLRLKKINEKFLKFKLISEQSKQLKNDIGKNVNKQLQQAKQQYNGIVATYNIAHKTAQKLTIYVTLAEQLYQNSESNGVFAKIITNYETKIKKYNAILRIAQTANQQSKHIDEQIKQRLKLQSELKQLSYIVVNKKLAKAQRLLTVYEDKLRLYDRFENHITKYRALQNKYNDKVNKSVTILEQKLYNVAFKLKQKRQLKNKKNCPLCHQKLTVKFNSPKQLTKLNKVLTKTKQQIQQAKVMEYVKKVQAKIPANIIELDRVEYQRKVAKLRTNISKWQDQVEVNREYLAVKKQLKNLPKVQPIKSNVKDLFKYEKLLSKLQTKLYQTKHDNKIYKKLGKLKVKGNLKTIKKKLLQKQYLVSQLQPQLQSINVKLQKYTEQQTNFNTTTKQLNRITEQLQSLQKSIKDREILEALVKAYSTKGIRLLQIQSLAKSYINALNRFSSFIYSEPVKFFADIAPNKFDIMAERGGNISDIRYFSGAESRQFLALSALALIILMPNRLRTNLLILDEIEAGLYPVDRKKLATDFIPLLNKYVKNLVIITPLMPNDFYIPNAKELILIKEKRKTTWQ